MNTSVCTLGAATWPDRFRLGNKFGTTFPSSAISVNPPTVAEAPAPLKPVVCDPTIEGTCMRRPAFTRRARTVPVHAPAQVPCDTAHYEGAGFVLLNATPLIA